MKCDLVIGLVIGAIAGMALLEFCRPVKQVVEKGEEKLKEKVSKI